MRFYSIKEKLKNKKIFWNVKKDQFGIFYILIVQRIVDGNFVIYKQKQI